MQRVIDELMKLGPLPNSNKADLHQVEQFQRLLSEIKQPIADAEARELVTLFGPDECFGLAWTLLHIIETAPGWPLRDALNEVRNEWATTLLQRAEK